MRGLRQWGAWLAGTRSLLDCCQQRLPQPTNWTSDICRSQVGGRERNSLGLTVSLVPSRGQEGSDGRWGRQGLQEPPNPAGRS